jgi:hypothetical protein
MLKRMPTGSTIDQHVGPTQCGTESELLRANQILTTEHFVIQTGRAGTIADANGRTSLFVSATAATVVVLGFIGQVSQVGPTFLLFALVLLPALCYLGAVTFVRVLQSLLEDATYTRGINRIHHYYLEHTPSVAPYLFLAPRTDASDVLQELRILSRTASFSPRQLE